MGFTRMTQLSDPVAALEDRVSGRAAWLKEYFDRSPTQLMAALNALLIGSVMYRSRLLPRWIPTLGLIGAPILIVSDIAVLFGVWEQLDPIAGALTLPIGIWEFSFGVYMAIKGFRTAPEVAETSFGSNVDTLPALAA